MDVEVDRSAVSIVEYGDEKHTEESRLFALGFIMVSFNAFVPLPAPIQNDQVRLSSRWHPDSNN